MGFDRLTPNFEIKYSEERIGFKTFHFYQVGDQKFPSVSAILEMLDAGKSGALSYWSRKISLDSMKSALSAKLDQQLPISKLDLEEAYYQALKTPDRLKKEAADMGTECHAAIDAFVNLNPIPPISQKAEQAFKNFLSWSSNNNLTYISGDLPIASPSLGFGGRFDALAKDQSGNIVLLDWKTSNKLKVHNVYQVAAYSIALKETYNISPTRALVVQFPKSDSEPISQVEIDLPTAQRGFLCLLKLYHIHQLIYQNFSKKE